MEDLPPCLLESVHCPNPTALDYMLRNGPDIRMIRLGGDIWDNIDSVERYVDFGGTLNTSNLHNVFQKITDTQKLIRSISLFPQNMFDRDPKYCVTYYWRANSLYELTSTCTFENLLVNIIVSNCVDKLLLLKFVFDYFNKNEITNDIPQFLEDFIVGCFLNQNKLIVMDLIMFIISKFSDNISNCILASIINFYSHKQGCTWGRFDIWSESLLVDVLKLLNLQPNNKIMSDTIRYLPLSTVQYLHQICFDYTNLELVQSYPHVYPIFDTISYLHEIGFDFTTKTNISLIDFESRHQISWFIETVCKSDQETLKSLRETIKVKSKKFGNSLWQTLKMTYFPIK
jgi:hypothetical protein